MKKKILDMTGSHRDVATAVGCSERHVRSVRKEAGAISPRRRMESAVKDKILGATGSCREVAKAVGCSMSYAYEVRKEAGLIPANGHIKPRNRK